MFDIKKKRDGSLVLLLNTDFIGNFFKSIILKLLRVFLWLDQMQKFSFVLLWVGAIGLGFGMGIIVFNNPDSSLANQQQVVQQLIPQKIEWLDGLYIVEEEADPIVSLSQAVDVFYQSNLSSNNKIVLYSNNLPFFEQVQLGTTIRITANNNGIYKFQVTQIKFISREDMNELINSPTKDELIIYQSDDILSTQIMVVQANVKS